MLSMNLGHWIRDLCWSPIPLTHPRRLIDPDGILNILGGFPDRMAGDPVKALPLSGIKRRGKPWTRSVLNT